jgi:hypothetical protein
MLTTGNDIQLVDILFGIAIIFAFLATLLTLHYQKKEKKDPTFHRTRSTLISFLCFASNAFFFVTFIVYAFVGITSWVLSPPEFYFTLIKIILWGFIPYIIYGINKKLPKAQAPGTLVTDDE